MTARRTTDGLPVLAMVDAFIGAISVILILTLLSEPAANDASTRPMPDFVLRCAPDGQSAALTADAPPIPLAEAIAAIQSRAEGRLSIRVLAEATPTTAACLDALSGQALIANQARDAGEAAADHPVVLFDPRFIAAAP